MQIEVSLPFITISQFRRIMITWLRFAYVSLAIWYFSVACKFGSIQLLKTRSTLYTIIYFLTLGISFLLFFFFFSVYLKLDLPSVPPSSNQWNVASEMAKPVQPAVLPENGRGELPDERDNEIVIELDRENQYGRTQPRANEPQGNHLRNIQMVHPHLMSPTHFFFFSSLRFFCSLVSRSHVSIFPLPTRFQSSDRYTGYPSNNFSWPNFLLCAFYMAINEIKNCCVNVADRLKRY